jgi:hypothetical protein
VSVIFLKGNWRCREVHVNSSKERRLRDVHPIASKKITNHAQSALRQRSCRQYAEVTTRYAGHLYYFSAVISWRGDPLAVLTPYHAQGTRVLQTCYRSDRISYESIHSASLQVSGTESILIFHTATCPTRVQKSLTSSVLSGSWCNFSRFFENKYIIFTLVQLPQSLSPSTSY